MLLSCESEEIRESVVPVVKPVGGSVAGLSLLAGIDICLQGHVLLAPDTEVTLDRASAHRTPVQFAEARRADARVPARQKRPRQREILADDAELFAGRIPQRTLGIAGTGGDQRTPGRATVVVARLSESQRRTQARGHIPFVVVCRVASSQV